MTGTWTFSPIQPDVHAETRIYPGEGETLRLQKLAEFARQFWVAKSRSQDCRVDIAAFHDRSTFTEEWIRQRRNWVSRALIAESRIPAGSISLNPPSFWGSQGGMVFVRLSNSNLPDLPIFSRAALRGDSAAIAVDPRCRPIGGNFRPFRPRKLLVTLRARSKAQLPNFGPPKWEITEHVEVELERNSDPAASVSKISGALRVLERKITDRMKEQGYEVTVEGQTIVEAEFKHAEATQWHTELSQKLNVELAAAFKMGNGYQGKLSLTGEVSDPEGLVRKKEFSGEIGIKFEITWSHP